MKPLASYPERKREAAPEKLDTISKFLAHQRKTSICSSDYSDFHISKNLKKQFDSLAQLQEELEAKEKMTEGPSVESDDDSDSEDDKHYGEELYLTDAKFNKSKKPKTIDSIFKKKKKEFQERRLREKQVAEEREQRLEEIKLRHMRRKLNPITTVEPDIQAQYSLNFPEKVPTFEEFLKILQDDEHFDPRYRNRGKHKTMKIAKRYNLEKEVFRSRVAVSTVTVADSASQRLQTTSSTHQEETGSRRCLAGANSRGTFKLPTLHEYGDIRDRSKFAEQVHGVTDSEPCKDHCLRELGVEGGERDKKHEKSDKPKPHKPSVEMQQGTKTDRETPDIVVLSPSGHEETVYEKTSVFPRISVDTGMVDIPDSDSGDDSSGDEYTSSFDSTKLNLGYR